MKNNTKVRLRLSKQLFESLSKQIIAEAKANDGYTVAVKQPKMPKQSKSQAASPEVQKTDKEVTMEMSSKEKMAKGLYKETDLEEGQIMVINKDFNLDGKEFKKGQRISTHLDFDKIEAAEKAGKIKQGEHFAMGVGGGALKETEKESVKKVTADITALSKEDQAKIKKFISSRSKKALKEEGEGSSKVYGGMGQNQGDTGSSLEFTISGKGRDEDGRDYVDIDYTIIPNSKNRQRGAGSRSPREKEYGYARITKDDIMNGYIKVKGDSYQIGKDFFDQLP